ncbi:hypothetical protein BDZ45DRAFT_738558 [Acephala macrosclerotiorum]|nr:hypothetical protein BDZ45DRAFT_738558 [Acephala macrosclerotiorum]
MAPYVIISLLYVTSFFLSGVLAIPVCTEIAIPVTITANNAILPPNLDTAGLLALIASGVDLVFKSTVSGSYNIAGRYCEPEVHIASRQNTLQLLAHPATYDRNYWSGGGYPGFGFNDTEYSWVDYASQQGYPTFAFDRLGNGNSSHPNSITTVQCPAQAATMHEIIKLARVGGNPFPRIFQNIIVVGASMGSLNANYLNVNYPQDVNATILTAFSKDWASVIPGFTVTAGLVPAVGVNYAKYGSLDPGYLQATIQSGVAALLFYGPGQYYDTNFIAQDYNNRGTITVGEAATGALIPTAHAYKGSVLVISGQEDVVFCGSFGFPGTPLGLLGAGNCGTGPTNKLAKTNIIYPSASNYSWFSVPNAGHCWEHQRDAMVGFKYSHDWLAGRGF